MGETTARWPLVRSPSRFPAASPCPESACACAELPEGVAAAPCTWGREELGLVAFVRAKAELRAMVLEPRHLFVPNFVFP